MEKEKRYAFQTRRGYLGYLTSQKTEIGTLQGITEFKTPEKAKIYIGNIEECIHEILDDSKEFQEYISKANRYLPKGEEKLYLDLIALGK